MAPRAVVLAAQLLAAAVCTSTGASPLNNVPSNARGNPTASAFFDSGGGSSSSDTLESVLAAGGSLSSPVSGQVSFKTKTRNGVRGLLPKAPKLRLWGGKGEEEGLDNAKRFLHITPDALVLEVEGEGECLSIARGPESLGGARVTVVARQDAGIEGVATTAAAGAGSSSSRTDETASTTTTIPVDGLFGVYDLLSGPFVAVISKSKLRYANRDLGVEFRQVSKVRLIPVLASPRPLDDGQAREEARLLALLALAFRSHQFYFSHAHDVTQTLQTLRVSASFSSSSSAISTPESKSRPECLPDDIVKPSPSKRRKEKKGTEDGNKSKGNSDRIGGNKKIAAGRRTSSDKQQRSRRKSTGGAATTPPAEAAAAAAATITPRMPPPDERFFWNLGVLGPLLGLRENLESKRVDSLKGPGGNPNENDGTGSAAAEEVAAVDRWLTPVMSGFLQVERGCSAGERTFDVMFVSRRSRLRQGTRYTRRGIDDSGNVANFVETEQSLLHEDKSVTSHVQIRGSIPVLWSSPTNLRYHPKVRIDPDQEASLRALRRHSEDLIRLYGKNGGGVVFVNLVDKKNEQGALGEAFDAALKAVEDGAGAEAEDEGDSPVETARSTVLSGGGGGGGTADTAAAGGGGGVPPHPKLAGSLRHVWFDFHHECRNMHWENLDKLLAIVDREFGEQGFYHAGPGGEVVSLQDGVVRTNCMDCLDRTNVVQSLLARRSMLVQLSAVGVDIPKQPEGGGDDSAALALTLDMLEMPAEELERRFRDVWGNNADEISMLYAGTPALKGDFTRTGQRTKMGLLQDGTNSAIRYVVNNFQDHRRQESVDLLLGVHRPVVDKDGNILGEFIQEPLDLDLWATRLSQPPPQQQQQKQKQQGKEKGQEQQQQGEKRQSAASSTATGKRGGAVVGGRGGPSEGLPVSSATAPPLPSWGTLSLLRRLLTTAVSTAPGPAVAAAGPVSGDDVEARTRERRRDERVVQRQQSGSAFLPLADRRDGHRGKTYSSSSIIPKGWRIKQVISERRSPRRREP